MQSKSKLDTKLKITAPKFKSGDTSKSTFMKNLEIRLENPHDDVVIADILGKNKLTEVIKNQKGSRFVQDIYYSTSDEEKNQIFEEIKDFFKDLMKDRFANYVIQKIFESGPENHKEFFGSQIKGNIISLSMEDHACRIIQKLLENLKSETRIKLVSELYDNVEKMIYNRNGNHVIQKCIEFVPEKYLDFIIEEVSENIYSFSKHKYGWRVIGKLIEFWKSEQVDVIVNEILPHISELSADASGNYVCQAILMHGKTVHKRHIISLFKKDLLKYSTNVYASNVIECLFKYCSNSQRKDIVKELLKSNKSSSWVLEKMLKDKYGNYVIQKMLEKLDETDRNTMVAKVLEITKNKQVNHNAKIVLKTIKEKYT
jgi:pumilio RNA-binding family